MPWVEAVINLAEGYEAVAPISVVSFDLDGTLVDKKFDDELWFSHIPRRVSEIEDIPLGKARRRVMAAYDEIGREDPRWFRLDYWLERFGIPEPQEEVIERLARCVTVYPDAAPCLDALRDAGFRLVLVTLARREFHISKLASPVLSDRFEHIFSVPSDFGDVWKDASVWERVVDDLDVSPEHVIHVGDDPEFDLEQPRSIGIRAYLIDREGGHTGPHVIGGLGELTRSVLNGSDR